MEVPKCCEESEMGGGEDEGSAVCGSPAWEDDGVDPEVTGGWWVVTVVIVVASSSSSEISMSSPEERGDA